MSVSHLTSPIEPSTVHAREVDAFATAVAGLHIDYVRTDGGGTPCVVTAVGTEAATLSVGSVGFSVIANTEIPRNGTVFALIVAAPPKTRWNGVEVQPGDLLFYGPGTTFLGIEPAGMAAAVLVVRAEAAHDVASDLRVADPVVPRSVDPLAPTPDVRRMAATMRRAFEQPRRLTDPFLLTTLVESAVGVMTERGRPREQRSRRIDSRSIVWNCLDYVEAVRSRRPSLAELCRAGFASESRVRQAFVDVVGVPPNRYFQLRLLSRLRSELTTATPGHASVTDIAMDLGVTQLGRVAGRYRSVYGELPSETLQRTF